MARKIAQSTCVRCYGIFPRTEMRQIKTRENSGSSFGVSTNPSSKVKNSTRVSGRTYIRNRKVWVCGDCLKSTDYGIGKFFKDLFKMVFGLIFVLVLYMGFVMFMTQ